MSKLEENKELEVEISAEEKKLVAEEEARLEHVEVLKRKNKAKKIFFIEVESEEEPDTWIGAYFRKPTLKEFSMFTTLAQKDKISALQTLMRNIFVDGDKALVDDDDYFLSAMTQIEDIVNVQASRIKKY